MRVVIENVSPEKVAKLLELLGQDALTIDAGAKSDGNGTNGKKPRAVKVAARKRTEAPEKDSASRKFRCKCGAEYAYRKSFDSHLVVNNDPDHGEVF